MPGAARYPRISKIMMKPNPLPLVIVFVTLTPSLAFSQNPQVTN